MTLTTYLIIIFFSCYAGAMAYIFKTAPLLDENHREIKPQKKWGNKKPHKIKMMANDLRIIKKFAWFPVQINRYQVDLWSHYRCQQRLVFHKFWGWRWINIDKWM